MFSDRKYELLETKAGIRFMGKKIRLDKFLADMGIGTRSEVKFLVKKGQISVNHEVARQPELKISPETDNVCYNGERISYAEFEYYMLNKPAGCVSATEDKLHKTVLDMIQSARKDLFPVGRLDLDTEGLLLITDDGELAHCLLSPRNHVPKTYYAKIDGYVTADDCEKFKEGLDIGEKQNTLPAKLQIQKAGDVSEITVTITEGKYHQVKRMFEAVGKQVLYLKRLSMGNLCLDETLAAGEYRKLTPEEIAELKDSRGEK